MKLKNARLPITNFINRSRIISIVINSTLSLFFSITRLVLKPFKYRDGSLVVILLHRLGDTIFTIPAIRELQNRYGKKVIILCFPESIPILNLEFDDLKFCSVDHKEFYFGQRIARHSVKSRLKNLKPEIILDITGSMISASLIYNIRAKEILGINRKQFSSIYDRFIPIREEPQLIDIYLDAISPLVELLSRADTKKRKKVINLSGRILIHPFAGWKEKEWNFKSIILLAERLSKTFPVNLIVQTNQISHDLINEIKYLNIGLIQTNSVEELIRSINECSVFIGNDSGPVNVANFLGKPTFSIYGATNPDYTASEGEHQRHIQKKLSCSARKNEKYCTIGVGEYDCTGIQCMSHLMVDEVYNNVSSLIEKYCNKKL